MNGGLAIRFAGSKNDRWEMGLVDRVREMLAFETEARVFLIRLSSLTHHASVQVIARVELDAGFGCEHTHNSAAIWFMAFGSQR